VGDSPHGEETVGGEVLPDDPVTLALDLIAHGSRSADPVLLVEATEIAIGHLHAVQLQAMNRLAVELPAEPDARGEGVDPAPAEVACAQHWSAGAARRRFELADELAHDLPEVMAALHEGRIDLPRAQEIADGTRWLHPFVRPRLATEALPYAAAHTRAQLRAWLARRVAQLDPEAAERRHQKRKRSDRGMWARPDGDGMATITVCLTAEEAQACVNGVRAKAAGVEGPIDAAMADAFIELLTGLEPGTPVPVQVILTANGPELVGHGPLNPRHAQRLADGAEVVDLTDPPPPTDGYSPAARLARHVRARDRHCRFPGCRRPATQCDLDHITRYPDGSTSADNLQCLCRHHHLLKTFTDWHVRILTEGRLEWTSPQGRSYITTLDDP
jgi:hypothetical protein